MNHLGMESLSICVQDRGRQRIENTVISQALIQPPKKGSGKKWSRTKDLKKNRPQTSA